MQNKVSLVQNEEHMIHIRKKTVMFEGGASVHPTDNTDKMKEEADSAVSLKVNVD